MSGVLFRLTPAQVAVIQPPVYLDRGGAVAGVVRPAAAVSGDTRPAATVTASPRSQGVLHGTARPTGNLEG